MSMATPAEVLMAFATASMEASGWTMPPYPGNSTPGNYYARRSAKQRAIHRARTGRK